MNYGRSAGLDSFRRCLTAGCSMRVYAPLRLPAHCRKHGGDPSWPQLEEPDPFGVPQKPAGADSSPAPAAAPTR